MILLLGRTGYIGSEFISHIAKRDLGGFSPTRNELDYTKESILRGIIEMCKPSVLINAAAYIPTPSVDLCKDNESETWRANVLLPVMLARVCKELGITFCHISTGCLYDEAKAYTEDDAPTRRIDKYAGFYVFTKYMSELLVRTWCPNSYIWRIRLPFDEVDSPRNYLSKLKSFGEVWEQENSLTHRGDFVKSALDMIENRVPFGVYNMVNSGTAFSAWLANYMSAYKSGKVNADRRVVIKGPVPGCKLSTAKLEATGCGMRPVSDAVAEALKEWRAA